MRLRRYVLAVRPDDLNRFVRCQRERCPYAVLGEATTVRQLVVDDDLLEDQPVDMPMQVLLGGTPKLHKDVKRTQPDYLQPLDLADIDLTDAVHAVLRHPTVASKSFLISIGDRSITGMVVQDQYVGRYQVPVADCAVFGAMSDTGEAMSMGERPPVALIDPKASARLAVGEAITNIAGAKIRQISGLLVGKLDVCEWHRL